MVTLYRNSENTSNWTESGAHNIPDIPAWLYSILAIRVPWGLYTTANDLSLKYAAMS